MKRIAVLLSLLAFGFSAANAQFKPEGMSFATELNYSPGGVTLDGAFGLSQYGAKFRFFINPNMAVRLSLGLNTSSDKDVTYFDNAGTTYQQVLRRTSTGFSIMPGFEYHFSKYERISPYVGAEVGLLTQARKEKTTNTRNSDMTQTKTNGIGFGVNAFTGVDIYLCKGLFLGVELGLGYNSLRTNGAETTSTVSGTTTENKIDDFNTVGDFGFHAVPALRLGWHF